MPSDLAAGIPAAEAEAAALARTIAAQQVQMDVLSEQYDQATVALAQVDAQIAATDSDLAAARRATTTARRELRIAALNAYMDDTSLSDAVDFFASGSDAALARQEYQNTALGNVAHALARLRSRQRRLDSTSARLHAEQTAATTKAHAVATAAHQAQGLSQAARATLAQVQGHRAVLVAQQAAQQAAQADAAAAAARADAQQQAARQAAQQAAAAAQVAQTLAAGTPTAGAATAAANQAAGAAGGDGRGSATSSPPAAGPESTGAASSGGGGGLNGSGPAAATTTTTTTTTTAKGSGGSGAGGAGRGGAPSSGSGANGSSSRSGGTGGPPPPQLTGPVGTGLPEQPGGAGAVALRAAESYLGVPYAWGGASRSGVDCSGLVLLAWRAAGVDLLHSAALQYADSTHIPLSQVQPGDLLFYDLDGTGIDHVVMYVGSGVYGADTIIQAAYPGTVVEFDPLWYGGLVGAARP